MVPNEREGRRLKHDRMVPELSRVFARCQTNRRVVAAFRYRRGTVGRVRRVLGAGGMGDVSDAEQELLGARRALKVLLPRSPARSGLAERIKIEARALAKLQHPNLVEVVDLGITQGDGRWYFAM